MLLILKDDSYAFGTQNGGLIIIDKTGTLLKIINKTTGLNDNTVWYVYPGATGELWLGLNNGISRVNYPTSLTFLDSHFGLDGTLYSVNEHQNKFYVTSANGVYYTEKANKTDYKLTFKKIDKINSESWQILDLESYQFIATTNGVYKLTNVNTELINSSWRFAYSFCRSHADENLVYVGLHDGLATLQFINGKWVDGGRVPGISEIIFYIAEDDDGTIWLSTLNKGIIRVVPNKNGRSSSYGITRYGNEKGIQDKGLIPVKFNDKILFGNSEGFLLFDKKENSFKHTNMLGEYFSNGYRIEDARNDLKGNIWVLGGRDRNYEVSKLTISKNGNLKRESYSVLNTIVENNFFYAPYRLYPDKYSSELLWITAGDKLYRFNLSSFKQSYLTTDSRALIREVKTINDSVLYYGGFEETNGDNLSEWNLSSNQTSIEITILNLFLHK